MAKKGKEARVQVILECTEHKDSGMPGTSLRDLETVDTATPSSRAISL